MLYLDEFEKNKKQKVHFLHIGKTGGTAIKTALKEYLDSNLKYSIILHNHGTSLKDVPEGEYVVFFLRDSISRFISGFYSRQRKGQPRYNSEWSNDERKVFEKFNTPNEVAIALADSFSPYHGLSLLAMEGVQHFRPYRDWYINCAYFESRSNDILFVGFQESLESDFSKLKKILEIPKDALLPTDDVNAHKNPINLDKSIDKESRIALEKWYDNDFIFIEKCKMLMKSKSENE